MSDMLNLSYEYCYADLKESVRQHLRSPLRRITRIFGTTLCVLAWICWVFLVVIIKLSGHEFDFNVYLFASVLLLLSVVFLGLNPTINALLMKRRLGRMFGETHTWEFNREGYTAAVGTRARGTGQWTNFDRLIRTPSGVLIYHPNGMFNWLPTRCFTDPKQVDTLLEMANANNVKTVRRT